MASCHRPGNGYCVMLTEMTMAGLNELFRKDFKEAMRQKERMTWSRFKVEVAKVMDEPCA